MSPEGIRDKSEKVKDDLYCLRHSLAHVLAQAVLQVHPKAKLAFGPPIENGFYYDFDFGDEAPLSADDLPEIENRMKKILKERQEFTYRELPADEAIHLLQERGETYKVEHCQKLKDAGNEKVSFYSNGPFDDLCEGPHVANTKDIKPNVFKLDRVSGAYWLGDETRPMLTRIYGLAFRTKEELDDFIEKRKLAMERDHRKLGQELELFFISEEVGRGLPMWLPNGTVLRDELEKFAKETEFRHGYVRVSTPHLTHGALYWRSGHLPYYKDSMYPPMVLDENEEYYLKPMNCPHHHMIYSQRPRSYRELPLRLAEYGACYRYEQSGTLTGLLRVRGMTMNDAHIYCREDQVREEFRAVLELHRFYYEKFRLSEFWMRLSLHDPNNTEKYISNHDKWLLTEKIVREILRDMGIRFDEAAGEAAFYGPKVDFQVRNVVGREETASTNQLDFASPERFNLTYIGEDNKEHRPYIIHRAPLGTHERFIAFLIEHFGGAFPTWMAPLQVRVLPVGEKFTGYAHRVEQTLRDQLIRVDVDASTDSFNKRVRTAVTHKIPNIVIVGGREEEEQTVTWRRYGHQEQRSLPLAQFQAVVRKMIEERTMDNFPEVELPAV